jgi:SIR2-like domain
MLQPKLGIPLVLTTNFDSFLEQALKEEGLMPKIFDIHRNAELPDPILVERQLSVLKLHGSTHGLRFGERLRQKLETDAREYIKRYLPHNALILVLGFSGSERRMMQLLQAIVENSDDKAENPRLIWIQGPGNTGPLYEELTALNKGKEKKIIRSEIKHADTFLQELYFKLANSHQASAKPYLSQPRQYLTEIDLEIKKNIKSDTPSEKSTSEENKKEIQEEYSPIQVFTVAEFHKDCSSGSLATLTATAFVQSLRQHRVIWIDLERHGTVESVIAEFFHCVKQADPKSPSFNFSILEPQTSISRTMEKVVDRICDVFQRGKYVLVLDSLAGC